MPAEFRIDQATPGAGTAGRSRHDLVAGEEISLTATSPAPGAGITYAWEILDKRGSLAVLSASSGQTVTIGAAGTIAAPCSFLIELTVNDNGVITRTRRIASVRTAVTGLRVPVFPETAPDANKLDLNTPDLSTDNALYADRSGLGSGQNWAGWSEWAWEIVNAIEAGGGGGSGGGGPLVLAPSSVQQGSVYTNWTDMHAAMAAHEGEKVLVVLEDSAVDAGAWDIDGWVIRGILGTTVTLTVPQGATFTGLAWTAENITIAANHTSGYIQSVTGATLDVVLRNATIQGSANGGSFYFFRITGFGNPRLTFKLERGSALGGLNGNVCETAQQGACNVEIYDGSSTIAATAFMNAAPSAGSLTYLYYGASPTAFLTQSAYNDPVSFEPKNDLRYFNELVKDLVLNANQLGTTELHVGSVYLTAGTVVRGSSAALLGGSASGETANLRMRRFTGGTIVGGDYTTIGTMAAANPLGGEFTIADSDFYEFYLFAGGAAETALIKGLRLVIVPSVENGV